MTTLLDYTVRMSALLCAALLLTGLLRRQPAALRHLILASAIFCAAALPILTLALPALDWNPDAAIPLLPPPVQSVVQGSIRAVTPTRQQASAKVVEEPSLESSPSPSPERFPAASRQPISEWNGEPQAVFDAAIFLQGVYVAGAAFSIAALLLSLVRLKRIARKTRIVVHPSWVRAAAEISREYGLRRPLQLMESDSPFVLATWGVFTPKVVVPADSGDWPEARIRVVLGHEFAHVRRLDWPVQLITEVLRAIFWFNPILWLAGRRLRRESEHACDDAVLNRGVPAAEYAAHLLDLARVLGSPQRFWSPALLMARPSTLEQRFNALLNPQLKRSKLTRPTLMLIPVLFLSVALPVAALRAAPQTVTESVRATAMSTAVTVTSAVLTALQPQATSAIAPVPDSIEGVVVRLGTGEPVSDVDVQLRRVEGTPSAPLGPLVYPAGNFGPGAIVLPNSPNPSDISNTRTRSDGRFRFTNLKPGTYRLQAARAGGAYYPVEYGQRSPRGKGYDFQFVEGQSMRDVRLQMAPTGSITGRVVDGDGQPAARVRVMALEATYTSGERTLGIIQAVQTDDRGEYRLFWLPPGQYVIAARQEDPRRQTLQLFITPPGSVDGYERYPQAPLTFRSVDGRVIEETFETVYYGGDPDVRKARTVDLRPGGSVAGVDLSLAGSRVRTRHVRGTVLDPTGLRMPGVVVTALPRNSGPSMVAPNATTDANGAFDVAGVGTGAYTLRAAIPAFAGFASLGAGDTDVNDLTIAMTRGGVQLHGKISVEGQAPTAPIPDLSAVSVRVENVISGLPGASSSGINGQTFTVNAAQAGAYRVFVNPILIPYTAEVSRRPVVPPSLQNAYVRAIRLDADDGLAGPVNIASQPGQLEIVVALNGGIVEGVVNDRQGPAPNALVVLVPNSRSRVDLYKSSYSDGNGRFRIQGITPADYKVFCWDYVDEGAWYDAAFLNTQESAGRVVRITEGNNPALSLTMERR